MQRQCLYCSSRWRQSYLTTPFWIFSVTFHFMTIFQTITLVKVGQLSDLIHGLMKFDEYLFVGCGVVIQINWPYERCAPEIFSAVHNLLTIWRIIHIWKLDFWTNAHVKLDDNNFLGCSVIIGTDIPTCIFFIKLMLSYLLDFQSKTSWKYVG